MGLKTEAIIFLSLAWGAIIAIAGYFTRRFLPFKKIKTNSINLIRKFSTE